MEKKDVQTATDKLNILKDELNIEIATDWGDASDGSWSAGDWVMDELERLHRNVKLLADAMGGNDKFRTNLDHVTVKKGDLGTHGGEAYAHNVSLSSHRPVSAWTVVHEFAHAWDGHHGWRLSVALEKYTGGRTKIVPALLKRIIGKADCGLFDAKKEPGKRGRLPGCNKVGYFYGDKPSGSDWNFTRKEDFAESVAMYLGWQRNNELSAWAHARVNVYTLENGTPDQHFGVDHWANYRNYFYPPNGDYAQTLRWKFVDELLKGKIAV